MEREVMERMSAALEALVALHAGNQNNNIRPSRAVILMKEIAYIKEFNGDKNQLTQFINVVGTHLSAVDNAYRAELWQAIYNSKITGKAKELLLNNPPQSWDEAKNLFKQHFRPACNYKDISRRISNLRVSSIDDLNCKLELIIQEINTFSTYETNAVESKKTFYTLLINRIKQLTSGNLSREIKDKFDLHEIKAILYTYIGYDYHNLDKDFMTHDRRPTQNTKPSRSDNNFSSRKIRIHKTTTILIRINVIITIIRTIEEVQTNIGTIIIPNQVDQVNTGIQEILDNQFLIHPVSLGMHTVNQNLWR